MRTTFRAAIAIVLLVTVLLVKSHLDSISQWQDTGDRRKASTRDIYVLEDGDAYIELVSADTTTSTPSNPTKRKWVPTARPTPRPMSASAKSRRIPVDVPGAEWAGQDPFFRSRRPNRLTEAQRLHAQQLDALQPGNMQKMAPSSSMPPRPTITPKSDRIIILGKMSYEDTDWLEDELPEYAPHARSEYKVNQTNTNLKSQMATCSIPRRRPGSTPQSRAKQRQRKQCLSPIHSRQLRQITRLHGLPARAPI
jgi:hypothetical protein